LHGGNLPVFASQHPKRVRRLLETARTVTTPSPYLRKEMALYRRDLKLLPNAVELVKCEYRARAAVQPSMVWLRAFHKIYNPMLAVEVLKRCPKRISP